MAIEAGYILAYVWGSTQTLSTQGLKVPQVVDADGAGVIYFKLDGTAVGWDYDGGTTDRAELIADNGDVIDLTRVGDRWAWTVTPDDLRGPLTAPGSESSEIVCQFVVTRTTAGSTVTNAPTRWESKKFNVTLDRSIGFSPDKIAGLQLWLDAYSITEAAGAVVTTWDDKSVYDRDVTEATNKPTRQTDGTGRPYLDFDGTNDLLASVWDQFGDPTTLIIVGKIDTYDATVRGFVQVGGTGGVRIAFDNANLKGISGADVANTSLPALDTPFVAVATKAASGDVTIQKGLAAAVTTVSVQAVTDGTVTIGDTAADSPADCQLYEVIVYDTVLSAENIARNVRSLQKKWAATG